MNRMSVLKGTILLGTAVIAIATAFWIILTHEPECIVFDQPWRTIHGLIIENGSAFDKAEVDVGSYKKLVVPSSFQIIREGKASNVQLFMKKTLDFRGHPPEAMSIRTVRRSMGCTLKERGETLVLGTLGAWLSKVATNQVGESCADAVRTAAQAGYLATFLLRFACLSTAT